MKSKQVVILFSIGIIGFICINVRFLKKVIGYSHSKAIGEYRAIEDEGKTKRLPHFIIIGAKKCGTTSLSLYLRSHPSLKGTTEGEPHFFDVKFEKGLDYYRSLMSKTYSHQLTFEKSPCYWHTAHVPQRIYESLGPKMKFLVMLRDPVDRIHSDYNFNKEVLSTQFNMREENHTMDELVFLPQSKSVNEKYKPIMASSYDDNMKRWLQFYPLESFFLIENNDLSEKPYEILREIETFLGIRHYFSRETIQTRKENGAKQPYNLMSSATRDILINYFRPHSLNFFGIVNRTFHWTLYP